MVPDPRFLEILKASGPQTTALAAAFGSFLLLAHFSVLPLQEPWVTSLVTFALLVCGSLSFASMFKAANDLFNPRIWYLDWFNKRQHRRRVLDYIPYMTTHEREIIGYLLARHQKTITADRDGGYATTLISWGILVMVTRPGQIVAASEVPFLIPDYLWDIFLANKAGFPSDPGGRWDYDQPPPWRRSLVD